MPLEVIPQEVIPQEIIPQEIILQEVIPLYEVQNPVGKEQRNNNVVKEEHKEIELKCACHDGFGPRKSCHRWDSSADIVERLDFCLTLRRLILGLFLTRF